MAQSRWLSLLLAHLTGRAVRARVDREDLAQEVFLRVLAMPAGLPGAEPGEAALRGLLRRVARNCVIDVVRTARAAKRRRTELRLDRSDWSRVGVPESELAASVAGPATRAATADDHRRLMDAFARLSPEHRRVIGLRQLEGHAAAEVARRMGRSETAVHSLYRRALLAWAAAAPER
jgi:RNA polymerase sigma factor (sigma-70 family)